MHRFIRPRGLTAVTASCFAVAIAATVSYAATGAFDASARSDTNAPAFFSAYSSHAQFVPKDANVSFNHETVAPRGVHANTHKTTFTVDVSGVYQIIYGLVDSDATVQLHAGHHASPYLTESCPHESCSSSELVHLTGGDAIRLRNSGQDASVGAGSDITINKIGP